MRRPSFQFYPADWRSNAKLRRCSRAERGDWIEIICMFHDSEEEYGVLRWPLSDLAQAVGCRVVDLQGLRAKGVLKGADAGERCQAFVYRARHAGRDGPPVTLIPEQDGPIWFSSRMVRDEYIRTNRATQPQPEATPKGEIGAHQSRAHAHAPAQSSSSSSSLKPLTPLSGEAPDDARAGKPIGKAKRQQEARAIAARAIEYLNEKAGTRFQPVEANLKLPVARLLHDGASEADLRAVVDMKVAETARGEFDHKYLRPATLWNAEKFAQYLGQVNARAPAAAKPQDRMKVYADYGSGKLEELDECAPGRPEEVARRVLAQYQGAPRRGQWRNIVTQANGTQSFFSVTELSQ